MLRVCVAGLGLALLLFMTGDGAAQAQRSRPQPVQTVPSDRVPAPPARPPENPPPASAESVTAPPAAPEPAAPPPAQPAQLAPEPAATSPAPLAAPQSGAPPLVDPRVGQQGPVSIRVIPTPKTEEELIAERQEREQRATLQFHLTLLITLLVGIGFLQLIAIAAQGIFLWIGLSALRRPLEVAERNLEIIERAFVYVGSLDWSIAGSNVRVTPVLENGGATPTRGLRISTNWRAWHGELPPDFIYNYVHSPDRLFLGARSRVQVGAVQIPVRDIQAAIEQRLQIYLWGRATYEDMFEGSAPHFVEFCYRVEPSGAAPDSLSLAFEPYGPHNRSEQDSQRASEPDRR